MLTGNRRRRSTRFLSVERLPSHATTETISRCRPASTTDHGYRRAYSYRRIVLCVAAVVRLIICIESRWPVTGLTGSSPAPRSPDPHRLLLPHPPALRAADQREPGSPELAENPRESTLGAQGFQYPESVDFTRPPRPAREPRCYSTRLRRAGLNRHNQRAAITPARSHSVINHELQSRSRDRHQSSALYFAIVNTHHRLDRLSRTSLQQAY